MKRLKSGNLEWKDGGEFGGQVAEWGNFRYRAWHWCYEIQWPLPVPCHTVKGNSKGDIEIIKGICDSHYRSALS